MRIDNEPHEISGFGKKEGMNTEMTQYGGHNDSGEKTLKKSI